MTDKYDLSGIDSLPAAPAAPTRSESKYDLSGVDAIPAANGFDKSAALFTAAFGNPSEEAEKRRLASDIERITGTFAPVVDIKDAMRQRQQLEADHVTRASPRTSAFLSVQENAAVAIQDAKTMAQIEAIIGGDPLRSAEIAAKRMLMSTGSLGAQVGFDAPAILTDIVGESLRAAGVPNEYNVLRDMSTAARRQAVATRSAIDYFTPEARNIVERAAASAGTSAGMSLQLLPLASGTPQGAGMAAAFGLGTLAESYTKARDAGKGVLDSLKYAIPQGAYEALFEMAPAKFLSDALKTAPGIKQFAVGLAAREVPTELATTLSQNFNDWVTFNPEKPLSEFLAEQPEALAETAIATIMGAGIQAGVIHTAQRVTGQFQIMQEERRVKAHTEQLTALFEAAKNLKSDPVTVQSFMSGLTDDAKVFVDTAELENVLAQNGIEMAALPTAADLLSQGPSITGDLEIPIGELVTAFAGTPGAEQIVQHARRQQSDLSAADYAKMGDVGAFLKASSAEVMEKQKQNEQFQAELDEIEASFTGQLPSVPNIDKTGYTPRDQRLVGTMVRQFYAVAADFMKTSPKQVAEMWAVKFPGAEQTTTEEQNLSQPATRDTFTKAGVGNLLKTDKWAILTAENPGAQELSPEQNAARNAELVKYMTEIGVEFTPVKGQYGRAEASFVVTNITPEQALAIGKEFDQESVLTRYGYVYQDGSVTPATGLTVHEAPPDDYFTTLPDGTTFTVDLDFAREKGLRFEDVVAEDVLAQSQSTRRPTTKKAPEDHLGEVPLAIDYTKIEPEKTEQNMKLVSQYPGIRFKARKADGRAEEFIQHVTNNLLWLHDQIPADIRQRSKLWYDGARAITDRWSAKYGKTDAQIAAILAVYSPQKDWFMNVSLAERTLDIVQNQQDTLWSPEMSEVADKILADEKFAMLRGAIEGKKLSELKDRLEQAAWLRTFDEAHNNRGHRLVTPEGGFIEFATSVKGTEKKTGWPGFGTIIKALYVIDDGSPKMIDNALGGEHKVRSFYNNIFHPTSDLGFVTIDTHAVAAGLLRPLSGDSVEVTHNFGGAGTATSAATGMSGTYAYYQEAYRRAAEARGLLPREMQSITWEAVRELYTMGFKHDTAKMAVVDKLWSEYEKGKRDLDSVRVGILNLAGGVEQPSWVNRDSGISPEGWASTYTGELLGDSVPRRTAGVEPGSGERAAAGISDKLKNHAAAVAEYNALNNTELGLTTEGGRVLNTDLARELSPGYQANRALSQAVHEPASAFIKKLYAEKLAAPTPEGLQPVVVFTAGGTGAGKSSGLKHLGELGDVAEIIYDTNMNTLASSTKKIEQALAAGRSVVINYTYRDPVEALTGGALPRAMRMGRTVPLAEHVKTHVGSREVIAQLEAKYQGDARVEFVHVDNSNGRDKAVVKPLAEIPEVVYPSLQEKLNEALDQEHQAGRISPIVYAAFRADAEAVRPDDGAGDRGQPQPRGAGGELAQAIRTAGAVAGPVVGIHFSKAPRTTLSSSAWGTGLKGAEGDYVRAAKDTRLRHRIAFYVNTGKGIFPESGVGGQAHVATLTNLYDADADVLKIWRNNEDERARESAVLDAGFDGFLTRSFGRQGAVVMLGQRNLPVEPLGSFAATAWEIPKELQTAAITAGNAVNTGRHINDLQSGFNAASPEAQTATLAEILKGLNKPHDTKAVAGFMDGRTGTEALAAVLAEQDVRKVVTERATVVPPPEIPKMKQAAIAIMQNRALVTGKQSVESWKRDLERVDPDTAALIDWANIKPGDYYKDEIAGALWQTTFKPVDTESAEFKAWFGDSKVVTEGGKPLVVYHGSKTGGLARATSQFTFFTADSAAASTYALDNGDASTDEDSIVNPVYVRMVNPLVVNAAGEEWMRVPFEGARITTDSLAREAKRRGYDGLIVRNVIDNVNYEELPPSDVYVTLGGKAQIKSAISNTGEFSDTNPSILFAEAAGPRRGSFNPLSYELRLTPDANRTTVIHELSHFFMAAYIDMAQQPNAPAELTEFVENLLGYLFKNVTGGETAGGVALGQKVGTGDTAYRAVDINSAEFKAWFGGSKVVDAEGRPLRVYHATTKDFAEFRGAAPALGRTPRGEVPYGTGWFAESTEHSNQFVEDVLYFPRVFKEEDGVALHALPRNKDVTPIVYPVYLDISHPFDATQLGDILKSATPEHGRALSAALNMTPAERDSLVSDIRDAEEESEGYAYEMLASLFEHPSVATAVARAGHDGIKAVEAGVVVWAASVGEQIKSAISNTGTFQGPNILHQNGGPTQPGPLPEGRTNIERWNAMTLDQQRPYWEAFAEGFEQYALTGKAPTKALQTAFSAFAKWMKSVYQTAKNFLMQTGGKPLDAELTQYFDRMLATDAELEAAREERGYKALFKQLADSGMSPAQFADYMALDDLQKTEAEELLRSRSIRDMKWLSGAKSKAIKELQAEAAELRAMVELSVEEELAETPIRRAETWLRKGEMVQDGEQIKATAGFKLNSEIVKAMFPQGAVDSVDLAKLKQLMSSTGTQHPDEVAAIFGFRNGETLVRELLELRPFKEEVRELTDLRMIEEHGDLATPEAIDKAADEAIHNNAHLKMIATEVWAANNRVGSVAALTKAAKAFAENLINNTVVKKLSPVQYANAATKAGKMAVRALGKGDKDTMASEKRIEMINAAAAKQAYAAEAEVRAIMNRLRKIAGYSDKHSSVTSREFGVVQAVRAILADFEIGSKGEKASTYVKTVAEYDPQLGALLQATIDEIAEVARPWDQLKVADLRELHAAVNGLWMAAREVRNVELAGEKMTLDEARAELIAKINETRKAGREPGSDYALTDAEIRGQDFMSTVAIGIRPETWVSIQDGLDEYGPWRRLIWNAIERAQVTYQTEQAVKLKELRALLEPIMADMKDVQIDATEIGYTFGKGATPGYAELLHAIIHTGNASNKERLLLIPRTPDSQAWGAVKQDGTLDSSKWDAFMARMFAEGKITKQHMDFVQGVWDWLESTKEGAQKAHRATTGRYFPEIPATELVTPFGTYRGGYAPAMADRRLSPTAEAQKAIDTMQQDVMSTFEKPLAGFTKERSASAVKGRPLELNIASLGRHVDAVLLFSHMSVPVRNVQRVLRGDGVLSALTEKDRDAMLKVVMPWLNSAVSQRAVEMGKHSVQNWRIWSTARSRGGMATMMANVSNSIQQLTGFFPAFDLVSGKELIFAASKGFYRPRELAASVAEMSPYMRQRLDNEVYAMTQEVEQIMLNPSKFEQVQDWTARHAYFMQTAVDVAMSPIIWQAKFNEVMGAGQATATTPEQVAALQQKAIDLADSVVRMTQGSNRAIDVAAIEKGSPFYRMFMQFSGWFNTQANLLGMKLAKERLLPDGVSKYGRITMHMALIWWAPAIASMIIAVAMRGGPEDEEGDGLLDDWFAELSLGVVKFALAAVPIGGAAVATLINAFNDKPYDDRMPVAPVVSLVEAGAKGAAGAVKAIEDPTKAGRAIRDLGSFFALMTGLPTTPLTKAAGYATDVETGKISPTSGADAARGIVTGVASPESKGN